MRELYFRGVKQYHSPEQIAGRLKREEVTQISHETIYQMIYSDHAGVREYQKYLRQGRGKRRKRGGVTQSVGRL